jgi:nicotinamidase-related amidase
VSWLVVIDMQDVFADPSSDWHAPGTSALVEPVNRLAAARPGRVVLTRFVSPPEPAGAWVGYYRQWPFALQRQDAPIYRLMGGLPAGPVVDCTTFSKWGAALATLTAGADLVLCGVATDCCVLSTALAAADAGIGVRVVADACAGSTEAAHIAALEILAGYAPIVVVTSLDEELAVSRHRDGRQD